MKEDQQRTQNIGRHRTKLNDHNEHMPGTCAPLPTNLSLVLGTHEVVFYIYGLRFDQIYTVIRCG
jgi:hypothetical protein